MPLTEEHKQKMAEGRARARELKKNLRAVPSKPESDIVERVTANVIAALESAGVIHKPNGKPATEVDYEVPSLTSRPRHPAPPPEPEPEPEPTIDPAVERFVALVEQISPAEFSYESCSAMLVSLRTLESKLQAHLASNRTGPATIRCAVCRGTVNPERPAGVRTYTNPSTGMQENRFFDKQACVLIYDSGRKDGSSERQIMSQRITLEP